MRTVRVNAASKSYDVLIGKNAVTVLGEQAKKLCPGALKALVVSETNVAPLYLGAVKEQLEGAGFEVTGYVFEAGEQNKNINEIAGMWNRMAEAGFTRTDFVVGLGGGVTTDMAGFAASTFLRGIKVIQLPTSLLAMVDASVGGKTGIDIPMGKNQVGAFWQPSLVLEDTSFLKTLPDEVFTEGMGEVTKHAFIMDLKLLEKLEEAAGDIRSDEDLLEEIVGEIRDEYEQCREKLKGIIGEEPSAVCRLPYLDGGGDTTKTLNDVALISCAVDTQDWNKATSEQIVETLEKAMDNGSLDGAIVLCHENYASTADAMDIIVPELKEKGWQVVTVSEMFKAKGTELMGGKVYGKVN